MLIEVNVPVPDQSYCLILHLDAAEARLLQLFPHSSELVSQTLVSQNQSQCRAQASYFCWGGVMEFLIYSPFKLKKEKIEEKKIL